MAPRFRALAALAENVGIAPSPHMAAKDGFKGWGRCPLAFTVHPGRIDIHALKPLLGIAKAQVKVFFKSAALSQDRCLRRVTGAIVWGSVPFSVASQF